VLLLPQVVFYFPTHQLVNLPIHRVRYRISFSLLSSFRKRGRFYFSKKRGRFYFFITCSLCGK